MSSRRAALSLRFIVVGGSVAGLSAAYALQTAGHQVLLLEQTNGKFNVSMGLISLDLAFNTQASHQSEGGLRSPPNMTKLLKRWPGMASLLDRMGTKCTG